MRLNRRAFLLTGVAATALPMIAVADDSKGPLPKGFTAFKGPSGDFFESRDGGERLISIRSRNRGGIVRYPIELAIEPALRIAWEWRVNSLPSTVAENTAETHDYSSIAVEFEDGRDLSWYWSAALPVGTHFGCPLPGWSSETHYVLRSGTQNVGRWLSEDRLIAADAREALASLPQRIVAIWLIAYTVPHKQLASTDFRRISVVSKTSGERLVFPGA